MIIPSHYLCNSCPNHCNIDRTTHVGKCGVGYLPIVSRVGLHHWEEPIISGNSGSGTIFFAGCNLRCVYCQNYTISHDLHGKEYTIEMLADAMRRLVDMGATNINFVTPSHYTHAIIGALDIYRPPIPIVYNTSGYDSVNTLRSMQGLIDIYMPDFKYLVPSTAARYSACPDYPEVAQAALSEMHRQQPSVIIENGIMRRGMLIRHLVLPGLSGDSVRIVNWLYGTFGDSVYLSVMNQYTPFGMAAAYPEINRPIKPLEYTRVVAALNRLGAKQVFLQEASAASTAYIPPFNEE